MTLLGNLPVLRAAADRLLVDTGQITIPGPEVYNEQTLGYEPGPPIVKYDGRMLVRPTGAGERVDASGATFVLTKYDVLLPAAVEPYRDQTLTVTASAADPLLVGTPMRLVDVYLDSAGLWRRAVAERTG